LRKLDPAELAEFKKLVATFFSDVVDERPSFVHSQFWQLWRVRDERGQELLVLLQGHPTITIPGESFATVFVLDSEGKQVSRSHFSAGYRIVINDARLVNDPNIGSPCFEIQSTRAINGDDVGHQYYAVIGSETALIRLEDSQGNLIRGKVRMGRSIGPNFPDRTDDEWELALRSKSPAEVLRTLAWLNGIHIQDLGVLNRPSIRKTLEELAASDDVWLRSAAALALRPLNDRELLDRRIRSKVPHRPTGTIRTAAGSGQLGYSGDGGPAADAKLNQPFDVAIGPDGSVYFSDTFNHCIRRVDSKSSQISTVAGCGKKSYSGDGGPATDANLNEPYGVVLDGHGNLFIVDRLNYCIRRVDAATGVIATIAGTGKSGFSGDGGHALEAMLREPNGIALDAKGAMLYIADVADQRVRFVDLATGRIETFSGTGRKERTGDGGPASSASLLGPRAVHVHSNGDVYLCEREGNSIRRVAAKSGVITTIAGTGKKGYTGDGGPAIAATFNGPKELDIDAAGNIFVVDTENQAIRRIDAKSGVVTTVAGNGERGGKGDGGPATAAQLDRPHGVAVDRDGKIYIGDTNNHRIRIVE
jgi:streptogramin lyase